MKLSLLFYPNVQKANKSKDKIPIYMRLVKGRKKTELRLNVEVKSNQLAKWDPLSMRFREKQNSANAFLNKIESKFEDFQYQSVLTLGSYDVKAIRNIIMGLEKQSQISVLEFVDKYYTNTVQPNAELTEGTKKNYRKAINHLKKFFNYRKNASPVFKDISVSLAMEFKDYLLSPIPAIEKTPLKEPSAFDIVKKLRTIFERALDEQLISLNPFKKIKLKSKSAKKAWLDIYHIRELVKAELENFPLLGIYRDRFLFSIYTGLSYSDTQSLSLKNLAYRPDGNVKLILHRTKTDVITEMFLPKQAIDILSKYKDYAELQITGTVLPGRSNKEMNLQVKVLAGICNLPMAISTHTARHSFRQLLAEADINETAVIKRMMGHSRNSDIDNVYYSVTESRLLEAKRKFEFFLNKFSI